MKPVPHGEPYAGKLHVRFDEGAGVPHGASRSTLHPFALAFALPFEFQPPRLCASAPLREIKNRPGRRAKRISSLDLESLEVTQ